MHWANQTADRLMENYREGDVIVCASGISPSGHVHIGNFREVITTHFVVEALKARGAKTRFIFSWDDYDRFRKVPAGIPESYSAYIGMPYSQVPDPFGCHASYAEHFEKEFEDALGAFDIHPEFIYQSEMYQNGVYTDAVREALLNRRQIYDIITSFKTQDWDAEAREVFYPINVYCRACGKDTMTHVHYDMDDDVLEYRCACGHHEFAELEGFNRVKLTWKVDWPMRWRYENVVFEPGGRDHSAENGSYRVSSEISAKIFGRPAPHYIPYEFIGLKGNSAKMSSSTGHLITPSELLKVYPREIVLFMFAKYHHSDAFDIGLDDDVNRLYTEYERYLGKLDEQPDTMREVLMFSGARDSLLGEGPRFSNIASTLPLLGFDRTILMNLMAEFDFSDARVRNAFEMKCDHAEFWLKNLNSRRLPTIQEMFNAYYYKTLTAEERGWVDAFRALIEARTIVEQSSDEQAETMQRIYDIVQHENANTRRKLQKRFFEIIYRLVLGQSNGPQITVLLRMVDRGHLIELLSA